MQDQGTEHTLRSERFYLNYLTMPESAYIPQPSSRQRELKPLNSELVGVICAVKSGPGTKERVTTRVTVYVRSRSTTLKGVFTVRITHSWWRGSQWGTSGDNQGYARHARMVVCVFFVRKQVCLSSLQVCVCSAHHAWLDRVRCSGRGIGTTMCPYAFWLSGRHGEGTASEEGSALCLRCMTSSLLQKEGGFGTKCSWLT